MRKSRLFPLLSVAVMTALATVIYMIFPEIPLVPGVEYLKVDLSDIPAFVTTMTFGPWYGIAVEILKNGIHLTRTTTFGIGELINSIVGSGMIVSFFGSYRLFARWFKKDTPVPQTYYAAAVISIFATILIGWLCNAALTPLFYRIMHWPLTATTLFAGIWGSTLLNAIKSAITVLPFYWLVKIVLRNFQNYI